MKFLANHYGKFLIFAGITFAFSFLTASGPHPYAAHTGPDYSGIAQLIGVIFGGGGVIGFIKDTFGTSRNPTLFRQAPSNYQGPTVKVQIFSHKDQFGRDVFTEYRCYAIEDPDRVA